MSKPIPFLYVAAPYGHSDPAVVAARMVTFDATIADIIRRKIGHPVSPLLYHAIVARYQLPANWDYWQHYGRLLLDKCDEVVVLEMPEWESSVGVAGEIEYAKSKGIPVSRFPYMPSTYVDALHNALASDVGRLPFDAKHALREARYDVPAARRLLTAGRS